MRLICVLVLVSALWLGGAAARGQLLPEEERVMSEEIQRARARLSSQQPGLTERELSRLAEIAGRSNYLARAIAMAVQRNDFTNAARLLKEFPGTVNDVAPFGQPLLHNAVQSGSTGAVSFLLEHKADPNRPMPGGQTLLTMSMQYSRWPMALQLLEAGASATRTNTWGQTPLALFLNDFYGRLPGNDVRNQVLAKLLEQGADAFAPMGSAETNSILDRALSRQDGQFSDLLLTNRPSPLRRTPEGNTALHLAALYGLTNALEFLLAAGFAVDQTNADGLTALQLIACSVEQPRVGQLRFGGQQVMMGQGFGPWGPRQALATPAQVAELLLNRGAKLEIFCAAGLGRTNELKAQLRAEPALAKARDGIGRTALHYAAEAQQVYAARTLLQSGADASVCSTKPIPGLRWGGWGRSSSQSPAGTSPLHLACLRGQAEMVQLLLRAGAAVALADSEGNTALHLAARGSLTNCTALLAAAHSPLNVTNLQGKTALRLAVESSGAANVELLLKVGAQPKAGLTNETLMHLAAERASAAVLQVLYRHGLALEPRDGSGRTPFQRAVVARNWDTLSWLRDKGADLNAADTAGNTALHLLSPEQYEMVGHSLEQSPTDRLKQQWLSQPGKRQQLLQKLIQWKLLSPPPPTRWTNSSLTVWLMEYGAKPNTTNRLGQTPLYTLCAQRWLAYGYGDNSVSNRVADLLKAGARPDLPDVRGVTPLHVAASNAAPAVLSLLLQSVPRPGALRDRDGHGLLYYALQRRENASAGLAVLLAAGLDPNETDLQGRTPLHWLLETYNPNSGWWGNELLPLLLTNSANLNLRDREGRTPLHLMLGRSNLAPFPNELLHLLAAKGDFTVRDHAGQTPIHSWASITNGSGSVWSTLIHTVLTNKALLSLTNSAGDTPLHTAIRAGNYEAVRLLLDAGADPALRNARGDSAFRLAVARGAGNMIEQRVRPPGTGMGFFDAIRLRNRAAVDLWLQTDPSLCSVTNQSGQTPLLLATAVGGDKGIERKLLAMGAPVDLVSALRLGRWEDFHKLLEATHGGIPSEGLFEAVRLGRTDAVQDLVNAGGEVQAVDAEGHSLLYRASLAGQTNLVEWLQGRNARETLFDALARKQPEPVESCLNANPALVNAPNAQGRPPLLVAAATGEAGLVNLLLARGAKLDAATGEGWTALHIAAARNFADIVDVLLRAGADPNRLAFGMGPLHLAAAFDASKAAALLLEHGADVNLLLPANMGSLRNTPLHYAAHLGCFETAKLLLAHGADVEARNWRGETPADMAVARAAGRSVGFPVPPEAPRLNFRPGKSTDRDMMLHLLDEAKARKDTKPKPAESAQ